MDDPLVGAAAEVEFRGAEFGYEWTIDKRIDERKDLPHALVCENLLV